MSLRRSGLVLHVPALLLAAALLSGCSTSLISPARPLPGTAIPPVVAVSSFDDRSGFAGPWQLSTGMADLLVSELVASRNFVVVERKQLDTVVVEIERQRQKHFRGEGRVEDGRLKNARYLIRGVVNDFSQVGGGSLAFFFRNLLLVGRGYRARVALTLTVVNVESGEILDSVPCAGVARASETYAEGRYRGVAFAGDAFFRTPLGVATINALRRGVSQIVEKMPRLMWEPMIAEVLPDGRFVINGGADRRIRAGLLYDARGDGRPVNDPITGDLLSVIPGPVIGRLRITRVEPKIAYAEAVTGQGFTRAQTLVPVGR